MPIYDKNSGKATADMYTKSRFILSGANLNIIALRMIENDDLCKLLIRNNANVLSEDKPLTDRERSMVAEKHISTIPVADKDIDVNNLIVVQISDIVPMQQGLTYNFVFDIICNIESWNLENYIQRPYAIMNELDQLFTNTKMKSLGPAVFLGATNIKINEKMLGYTMMFSFSEIQ